MRSVSRVTLIAAMLCLLAVLAACASRRDIAQAEATASATAVAAADAPAPLQTLPSGTALLSPRPGLYTGGQPGAEDWSALAAAGVRTVVNLRPADELQGRDARAEVEAAGLRYVEIPVAGAGGIEADKAAQLSALLSGADGQVLVHCASGNRVGGLLAVAMAQSGMDPEQAIAFGRSAGMKSTEARAREVIAEQVEARRAEVCATGAASDTAQCAAP